MPAVTNPDAEALWSDVLALYERDGGARSTIEMMKSCIPTNLEDETLSITTEQKFVQRTLMRETQNLETYLERCAFQPIHLVINLDSSAPAAPLDTGSVISQRDLGQLTSSTHHRDTTPLSSRPETVAEENAYYDPKRRLNPLVGKITENDSKLTFDRFIVGEENEIAFSASKQVASGYTGFNPLFIYGKSGLGKTHLLKAIQNYISTNDSSRVCVYRTADEFRSDYVSAVNSQDRSVREELENNYHDVDVLIIDDVQGLKSGQQTTNFFFNLFNYLRDNGKQIVLAADRQPSELGAEGTGLDERITSRMDSGMSYPISAPQYELKFALIKAFYERMKEDSLKENITGLSGTLTEEDMQFMAEKAGSNIRIIEGFCQSCLLEATKAEERGMPFTHTEIARIANGKWLAGKRDIPIDQIQKVVETEYGVSHTDLIGNKRNKELMEPRHIAIWLTRELTDNTLADIGKRFGGRSHATVKHSISWVDETSKTNRTLKDQIMRLEDTLRNQ